MLLYKRELKGNLKSFVIWTACIVILTALFMAMYPSFSEQGESVNEMLSGFSPQLMEMFGFESIDFTQTMDYYGYIFQYVLLAVLIQFMLAGANLVSREEDSGTINFLYAKPLSRTAITGTKFLAGLTEIAAFFIVYTGAAIAILYAVNKTGVDIEAVLLLDAAMALGQLMMLGIGMLLGTFITRARTRHVRVDRRRAAALHSKHVRQHEREPQLAEILHAVPVLRRAHDTAERKHRLDIRRAVGGRGSCGAGRLSGNIQPKGSEMLSV